MTLKQRTYGDAHPEVANSFNSLGEIARASADLSAARRFFERALAIERQTLGSFHPSLCYSLAGLADVRRAEGAFDEAQALLEEALRLALAVDALVHLPSVYAAFSKLEAARGRKATAIFFGKLAVNAIQRQRQRLTALEPELQRSFIRTKDEVYRDLSELLVDAGRLGEAQQVLAMLKKEELSELLRREAPSDPQTSFAQLTSFEAEWRRHGDELGADLVRLTQEIANLRAQAERGAEDEVRLDRAQRDLDQANEAFLVWLEGLRDELASSTNRDARSAEINLDLLDRLQGELRELGPDVAMVSYVLGESKLSIILTTASLQVSREADIGEATMNRLVHDFRISLAERLEGRRPLKSTATTLDLARALWRHLIAPVEALLKDAKARTLMIVPFGSLRYLPMAALHDGSVYLCERFAVSILTLAARFDLRDKPQNDWSVAAFGVTRETPGYRPLVAVAEELNSIVQTAENDGVYPGEIRVDDAFTERAFANALGDHRVVHVASHFMLDAARGLNSHLLLGDGGTLSLQSLRARFKFHGVELVTLSACETAIGSSAQNGREFESFGAIVQNLGAKAVIASLWAVSDGSTARLMKAFYAARRSGLSKAAALQAAQIALLDGPNAHPHHWAPFILMGNWR